MNPWIECSEDSKVRPPVSHRWWCILHLLFIASLTTFILLMCPAHAEEGSALPPVSPQTTIIVHFDFEKFNVKPSEAQVLKGVADSLTTWLAKHPDDTVIIEGHADGRGTNEYSIGLSDKMAESVKIYLIDLGVPAGRIKTVSYGKERPVDPGRSEQAWAKNRRVEIRIKPSALIVLGSSAHSGQTAPPRPYESYQGCGEYIVAGTVHSDMNGFTIIINEKTRSEYTLKVPIPEEPKLAPYIDRPMKAQVMLDKQLNGTIGAVTAVTSVQDRTPNPLHPLYDTGFRLIQKMDCKE